MNVAMAVRLEREAHPERFCSLQRPPCLWRLKPEDVGGRCPRHRLPAPLPERLARYSMFEAER